jgi:hypothetical protein
MRVGQKWVNMGFYGKQWKMTFSTATSLVCTGCPDHGRHTRSGAPTGIPGNQAGVVIGLVRRY